MPLYINQNESNASLRLVPFWLVQSNGTTPASLESGGRPQWIHYGGGSTWTNSTNTLSSTSSTAGRYMLQLTQSECSVPGIMEFRYSSTTCFEQAADDYVQFVSNNPYKNLWDELTASHQTIGTFGYAEQVVSNKTLLGGGTSRATLQSTETSNNTALTGAFITLTYGDGTLVGAYISSYTGSSQEVTFDRTLPVTVSSGMTYVIYPQSPAQDVAGLTWNAARSNYSTAGSFGQFVNSQQTGSSTGTIQGVSNTANFPTSGGSTGDQIAQAVWGIIGSSGNTRTLTSISTATVLFVTNVTNVSNASLAAGSFSGATVQGVSNTANFPSASVNTAQVADFVWNSYITRTLQGTSSAATIGGVLSVVTVQGMASAAASSIASSVWSTNFGNNRLAQEAIFAIRNRVLVGPSLVTVYLTDDVTSSWTASYSTGVFPLSQIDPSSA